MADVLAPAVPTVLGIRIRSRAGRRLLRHRGALVGGILIAFFLTLAIAAPLFATHDPMATDWMAVRKAPSAAHWMGTDEIGRDVYSRLVWGARTSLLAGVVSVCFALAFGVPLGVLAGYVGGWTDTVISRCNEAVLSCPFLILAIAFAAFLGPSLTNAMIAIGLSAAPIFVRLARGQTLVVKAEEYVDGARSVGLRHPRILWRYILPNIFPPLLVQATLTIATAIIAEASLSFLGLGQQPPSPSWGSMLSIAKNFITHAPWMSVWPGVAIFLVVFGFNLLGDGLRDALDPRGD